ncbi:putative HAT dimerization domain, ribonuclease H-like superfamily [Helianthus anomalus]
MSMEGDSNAASNLNSGRSNESQKKRGSMSEDSKTEVDRYLKEEIEGDDIWFESQDFTVLDWWKKRSGAFPILSLVARDILAIPISTMASESTFSTGGRVLDTFRSSLSPPIVEALICCQDWIRSDGDVVNLEENIGELDKLEEEMKGYA